MVVETLWFLALGALALTACTSLSGAAQSVTNSGEQQQAPCVPVEGKTGLVVGQDYYSTTNYTAALGPLAVPFGTMAYTSLRGGAAGGLRGLWTPVDYGSGVQWASGLADHFNTSALQLGLWLVGACEDVANDLLSREIHQLALYLRSLAPSAVYLRVGYEFDNPDNGYDAHTYAAAFRVIVKGVRAAGAWNVAFVWHSWANGPSGGRPIRCSTHSSPRSPRSPRPTPSSTPHTGAAAIGTPATMSWTGAAYLYSNSPTAARCAPCLAPLELAPSPHIQTAHHLRRTAGVRVRDAFRRRRGTLLCRQGTTDPPGYGLPPPFPGTLNPPLSYRRRLGAQAKTPHDCGKHSLWRHRHWRRGQRGGRAWKHME